MISPIPNLSLSSVLYVPKFPINLLSIYQLTNSHNCSVTFYPTHYVFQDLCTKKTIGSGQVINGVYHLDSSPPLASAAFSSSNSTFQWHYRLGHPPIQLLQQLGLSPTSESRLECQACELGKHHRSSFSPRINKRSLHPFDLVHSDVWGPCRLPNVLGFRYFLSFVDDFSRVTWLYLLKERLEVPIVI